MSQFSAIDLSTLPKPDVIEKLDYESLFSIRKSEFNSLPPLLLDANLQPALLPAQLMQEPDGALYYKVPVDKSAGLYYLGLESEPVTRLLQIDVYRELLLRQRVNDSAHAVMIAYAGANDLDNIAARYGVERLLITPATVDKPALYESDDAFRKRTLLSLEGLSTAGPEGAYIFHALSADGRVKDATAVSPVAGQVVVTILSHECNGTASEELLNVVRLALNHEDVRPITDEVVVQSVEIVEYQLSANITFFEGPSHKPVMDLIAERWQAYAAKSHSIGFSLEESAVMSALHQSGVWRVDVLSPVLPFDVGIYQAAYCTSAVFNDMGNNRV